ncbi:MAG: hypothetical protein RLZZ628_3449, partial [Bacteroidota bacterium]
QVTTGKVTIGFEDYGHISEWKKTYDNLLAEKMSN